MDFENRDGLLCKEIFVVVRTSIPYNIYVVFEITLYILGKKKEIMEGHTVECGIS